MKSKALSAIMPIALVLALTLACAASAADLPVRQVVLYKHGVGYFERSGLLGSGDSVRLDFKADQMNDVLKSLSITEKGGGKVSGVRYDSSIPLEQQLADFPFKIENQQPLSALLDQLRGARVELQFGTENPSGIVVGARAVPGGPQPNAPSREQITLLLDSGDLKTFDLAASVGIRFPDPKLQKQFRDYLTTVAQSRSVEKRGMSIESASGSGSRNITATYIVPSPVWKSSYRLLLSETAAPSLLEGWAIVDNTTGEDWSGVRLSLVSGKPISFISELYEPKYIERLTADLPEEAPQKAMVYAETMQVQTDSAAVSAPAPSGSMRMFAKLQSAHRVNQQREASSIASEALSQMRGELFEYTIATPVTIRKNESAMLPFLQGKIDARRLIVFSEGASLHPLQAAELKNFTGKTLDGGPITVFDAGTYAGEALVETVKAGSTRLISYAVDLGTTVTTAFDSKNSLTREIHLSHGVLTSTLAAAETKTYTASNVDAKPKTLIIEHAKRPGYDLLSPKTSDMTPSGYRFEVTIPASKSAKLAVSEEHVFDLTTQVSSLGNDQLIVFLQNKALSGSGKRALNDILGAKAKIAEMDRQIRSAELRLEALNGDAKRIRDNIATLNGVAGQQTQVQTYAAKLASIETEVSTVADSRKALQSERSAAQTALEASIATLEF